MSSAFLPYTLITEFASGKDWIEAGSVGWVYASNACAAIAVVRRTKHFDTRQVGFEGNPAVVPQLTSLLIVPMPSGRPEEWAAEEDRAWVQLPIQRVIGDGTGPGKPIFRTIEVNICAEAAADLDKGGIAGIEAANIVGVNSCRIGHPGGSADSRVRVGRIAIFEVPDLIREGNIVGVCRPRHASVLARRGIHWMEGIRNAGAGGRGRIELNLCKPVCDAGCHGTALVGGEVVNDDLEPGACVVHVDGQFVTRVHEQVGAGIGSYGGEKEAGKQWLDRPGRVPRHSS